MTRSQTILTVNAGSSSLKLRVFEMGATEELLLTGVVDGIGEEDGRLLFRDAGDHDLAEMHLGAVRHEHAVERAVEALASLELPSIEAVGHRIVHGGPDHLAPALLTPPLVQELMGLTAWAPLHLPVSLRVVDALGALLEGTPQVGCFDTAFHARMPRVARLLALPRDCFERGVRKYGFHGLSYEYVIGALGERARGRVIIAHLGNGASMVACLDGLPMDTTMAMTPMGGIMMGTRSGDLDPGVLLHLMREQRLGHEALEQLLDRQSGLKGVSGETSDMKELLELRDAGHLGAAEAVDLFCYSARKAIGGLAAVLGGVDRLVFTGGIGENASSVRDQICRGLRHLGVDTPPALGPPSARSASGTGAACEVLVVRTNEELVIARHTDAATRGGVATGRTDRRSARPEPGGPS